VESVAVALLFHRNWSEFTSQLCLAERTTSPSTSHEITTIYCLMKVITNSAKKKRDKPLLKLIFYRGRSWVITKGICSFIRILVGWGRKWGWVIKVGFVKFVHVPHNFWQAGDPHFLLIASRMNKIGWPSPSLLKGTKYFQTKRSTAFSALCTYVITAEHSTQAADCSYLETHVRLLGAFSKLWKKRLNFISLRLSIRLE
jgi:hypothetical protein